MDQGTPEPKRMSRPVLVLAGILVLVLLIPLGFQVRAMMWGQARPFEGESWRENTDNDAVSPRHGMADDLAARLQSERPNRKELHAMLGSPFFSTGEGTYRQDTWTLGHAPAYVSFDACTLCVAYDATDHVASVEVLHEDH